APQAYMEEFRVAGKTGTAQKPGDDGIYLEGENIVSFVGFAPANKPELLIYVAVDAPNIDGPYYGSTIAAPIFKEIMQNSLRYLKVPVATSNMQRQVFNGTEVPDVIDRTISVGIKRLQAAGLEANIVGEGKKIVTMFPAQGTKLTKGSRVIVVTEPIDQLLMPDLTGYALREAMDLCQALGLKVNWSGEGYVQSQSILAGKMVGTGAIELTLQPLSTPVVIPKEETDVNELQQSDGTDPSSVAPSSFE
ncbi:MAG: PASTA domain-containing protein, partial [Bacilli bacterium]